MGGHTFSCIHHHLIWSTKNREPLLTSEVRPRLYKYLNGIVTGEGGVLAEVSGTADHVHSLIETRPDKAIAEIVRKMKANSSKWIHETFPAMGNFAWQEGYGVFSVSKSSVQNVIEYIRGQEEHHRRRTFQEEYVTFLKKHGITFDERYLWA
jgi:REP element-mobilizing transposase RayT